MTQPPYGPTPGEPSSSSAIAVGNWFVGFSAYLLFGGFALWEASGGLFGSASVYYAVVVSVVALALLTRLRYRALAIGILSGVVAHVVLLLLAADFARGYWK